MEDRRRILELKRPFSYSILKDGKVLLSYCGKSIGFLKTKDQCKFKQLLELNDVYKIQLLIAKSTGNFKRGNEKKKVNNKVAYLD